MYARNSAAIQLVLICLLGCGGDGSPNLDDANELFLEARQAINAGDTTKAMELLDRSIEAKPYAWTYLDRAKLHAKAGNEAAASADVEAGLAIEPEEKDLKWLQTELKKPKEQRFKTPPPSALK